MSEVPTPGPGKRRGGVVVGHAVDMPPVFAAPAPPEAPAEPAPEVEARWGPVAVFKDQYLQEAELGLWRWGDQRTEVYNLLDKGDLDAWNVEQLKLFPEGAPPQVLMGDPVIHAMGADRLILIANFKRVEYNQVVPQSTFKTPTPPAS